MQSDSRMVSPNPMAQQCQAPKLTASTDCECKIVTAEQPRLKSPVSGYWTAMMGAFGSDLTLFAESRGSVYLTTGYAGPGVYLWSADDADAARAWVFVPPNHGGPQLLFHGSNGTDRVELSADYDGSSLELKDDFGKTRLRLVAERMGGRIEFLDDLGKVVNTLQ